MTSVLFLQNFFDQPIAHHTACVQYGLFAELPFAVEGFIPIETLEGNFEHIPERFLLKGTRESYSIGERIQVQVVEVDFYRRRTQFALLAKIKELTIK